MANPFIKDGFDNYYSTDAPFYTEQEPLTGIINHNKIKMKKGFTVLKLADLARELNLPSSKGQKTKDYLELVINQIEGTGLRFVQFLQLVDVLYVIIENAERKQTSIQHVYLPADEFNPEQEIRNHYTPPPAVTPASTPVVQEVQEREMVTEAPPELEELKNRDHLKKSMKKNPLPWEK
jgi:hypothetical protein